jgi:hypothetical protein
MIMLLLALFAVLTFVSWLILPKKNQRIFFGLLSTAGLLLTVGAMTLNFTQHLGMEEVTKTETTRIYSAGDMRLPQGILIAEPMGTDKNSYVMVYRDSKDDKKPSVHFKPNEDKLVDATKQHAVFEQSDDVKQAQVKVATTRLEWKNDLAKWLFGTSGQTDEIISEKVVVEVPSDWMVLTQAELEKIMAG